MLLIPGVRQSSSSVTITSFVFFQVILLLSNMRSSQIRALTTTTTMNSSHRVAVLQQRVVPFELPSWAQGYFENPPKKRLPLGNLPTPLYQLHPFISSTSSSSSSRKHHGKSILQTLADKGMSLYVKRDDMSGGVETGGELFRGPIRDKEAFFSENTLHARPYVMSLVLPNAFAFLSCRYCISYYSCYY
jgi:hypothetical protein